MKKLYLILGLFFATFSFSQDKALTLEYCYEQAILNYPLAKQKALLNSSNELKIKNLQSNYLPQINLNGQFTYQSEVTTVRINMPEITLPIGDPPATINLPDPEVPEIPKDMYKLSFDVNQMIYDGGVTNRQKEIQSMDFEIDQQQLDIELYKLKENINQVYFSIILLEEKKKLMNLVKDEIVAKLIKVESGVKNGVLLSSNADILKAEQLKIDQELSGIAIGIASGFIILEELTNIDIQDNTQLFLPEPAVNTNIYENKRLEYNLFDMQKSKIASMKDLINSKNTPKLFGFGQLGYGRPGLDMFSDEFKPYYLVGVGLNWSILNWKENVNEKTILDLQTSIIEAQKETFDKNIRIASQQQIAEIQKYEVMIEKDNEIIELRSKITKTASSQLSNGIITSTEYLAQLNEEKQARLNKQTHTIKLINAKLNYLSAIGKL